MNEWENSSPNLREPYKNCTKKHYHDFNNGEFSFNYPFNNKNEKVTCRDVVDYCEQEADKIKPRVWLLFAQKDENFECLQVAHSKNDVKTEVSEAISYIFDYSVFNGDCSNSQFYENVCPKPNDKTKYRSYLYRKIGDEYSDFIICFLNVNKYLGIYDDNSNKNDAERIVDICKNQYAEAKIAYETLALFWRKVSSGIDGQTISYIVEHPFDEKSK